MVAAANKLSIRGKRARTMVAAARTMVAAAENTNAANNRLPPRLGVVSCAGRVDMHQAGHERELQFLR